MNSAIRITQTLENADHNIDILSAMPDRKLVEKLEVIDLQTEIAVKENKVDALRLLEIWRAQVIAARIYKAENNIPDAPNAIELAIAGIETFVAVAEVRQELVEEEPVVTRVHKVRVEKKDDDSQMSLF